MFFVIIVIVLVVVLFVLMGKNGTLKMDVKSLKRDLEQKDRDKNILKDEFRQKEEEILKEFDTYKSKTEYLKKYEAIVDVEAESEKILKKAQLILDEANINSDEIKKVARAEAKSIREKSENKLTEAHDIATKIENDANIKAEEIAGEAWEAKKNADQYTQTVKAMKNIIKGYGDEYLIPNQSLLDDLAEEYDHKEAGKDLAQVRQLIKSMIKNNEVADCDYVEEHRRKTAIEFVIDAFNGKVDSIMSKVKHDNYGKMEQSLKDAFRTVNHNGKPFRDARINQRYFDVILDQLKLAVIVQELKKLDLEEQRRIREEMREEEKARREFEKALKQAEKEERMLEKAMKEAELKLASAAAEERAKFEEELAKIKEQLTNAEETGKRALSMAQQTKQGHVYVISNIGSFGEEVFKVGLTRRLEPLDRVKELGDASVPFAFDVHAMIHSKDAPRLEKELHEIFRNNQLNKVNSRKEFFKVPLNEIRNKVEELGLEAHWTMRSEALEYRESIEIEKREQQLVEV